MKLYSTVIKLLSTSNATLPYTGGQHGHAAFLDIVREVDPELSARLHDTNARKPFTVGPLRGLPDSRHRESGERGESKKGNVNGSVIKLREGWGCWLRVTILDDGLFQTFISRFMQGDARPKIRLGDGQFLVSEILTTPGSHPWAGYTTLDELLKRLDEPTPKKFAFELHTPTQFGYQDDWKIIMPLPRFVFGNLARTWKHLTGEDNVRAVEEYAETHLIFGNYDLKTESALIENKPHPGAIGKFEYLLTDAQKTDQPLARGLNMLADLAFYSGLGRKTPQGMGQVSRITA